MAARHELVTRMTHAQSDSTTNHDNYHDDNPLNLRPLATAPSLLCVGCGGESDPVLITPCFHVYCMECIHSTIMRPAPCKSCGASFFEFKEYARITLVDVDGNPKDERVKKTLKLLGLSRRARAMPDGDTTTSKLQEEIDRMMALLSGKDLRTMALSHVVIGEKARSQNAERKPGHLKEKVRRPYV